MIGLSRQLVCDPFWPIKAALGNDAVIRRWDWLDEDIDMHSLRIRYALNSYLGHEEDYSESTISRVAIPKTVAVVGGLACIQAAITSSKRRPDVMLWATEAN